MDFYTILDQVIAVLRQRQRVTYRALKRQFNFDDDYLEDVKAELIQGQRLAVDEDGAVLVWAGEPGIAVPAATAPTETPVRAAHAYTPPYLNIWSNRRFIRAGSSLSNPVIRCGA
jgi:hypothetical protein